MADYNDLSVPERFQQVQRSGDRLKRNIDKIIRFRKLVVELGFFPNIQNQEILRVFLEFFF